jgi:hypothetical protein
MIFFFQVNSLKAMLIEKANLFLYNKKEGYVAHVTRLELKGFAKTFEGNCESTIKIYPKTEGMSMFFSSQDSKEPTPFTFLFLNYDGTLNVSLTDGRPDDCRRTKT